MNWENQEPLKQSVLFCNTVLNLSVPTVVGNGKINAYTTDGEFVGQLTSHGRTIVIDGLWVIGFAALTATAIDPNRLYFTAGPSGETDGLFGYLIKK